MLPREDTCLLTPIRSSLSCTVIPTQSSGNPSMDATLNHERVGVDAGSLSSLAVTVLMAFEGVTSCVAR